jgi:hypothetical protein
MANVLEQSPTEVEPRQDFPLDTFNELENRLRALRIHLMRRAGELARTKAAGPVYRVKREHVLTAIRELISHPATLASTLGVDES